MPRVCVKCGKEEPRHGAFTERYALDWSTIWKAGPYCYHCDEKRTAVRILTERMGWPEIDEINAYLKAAKARTEGAD